MVSRDLGSYVLDTLQLYFPWNDDLYTYLKKVGLASRNPRLRALPLIYTDNCPSTQGVPELPRNYIIRPERFGTSLSELGWRIDTELRSGRKRRRYFIPSEKPQIRFFDEGDLLKLKILPSIDGKEEYHLEYSIKSSVGKTYINWVNFYLPLESVKTLAVFF